MQIERRAVCAECNDAAPRVRKGKRFLLCEDCRRADSTRRWKVRRALRALRNEVGRVVEFNQGDGWRAGYLVKIMSANAEVQPIGAAGRVPDTLVIGLANVKAATCGSASMPTIEDFYKRMEAMKPKKVVVLVSENELAGPEVGDVSFPFGANAPVQETAVSSGEEKVLYSAELRTAAAAK